MRYAPDENQLQSKKGPAMEKHTIVKQKPKRVQDLAPGPLTIGIDLGDKASRYCVLDENGIVQAEGSVATTKKAMAEKFGCLRRCRVAIEVGTHSPWVSRWLSSLGHEMIVANARQVQLISASSRKDDRMDAQMLARLARVDPQLLRPIHHRGEKTQSDLLEIRVRSALVEARTSLVNAARGLAKGMGVRLPSCDAANLSMERVQGLPGKLSEQLQPLLGEVQSLTEKI